MSIISPPDIVTGSEAVIKNNSKHNGKKIVVVQHRGTFCWVQLKDDQKIIKVKAEHLSKIIPPMALKDDADIEKWLAAYKNIKADT